MSLKYIILHVYYVIYHTSYIIHHIIYITYIIHHFTSLSRHRSPKHLDLACCGRQGGVHGHLRRQRTVAAALHGQRAAGVEAIPAEPQRKGAEPGFSGFSILRFVRGFLEGVVVNNWGLLLKFLIFFKRFRLVGVKLTGRQRRFDDDDGR